MIALAVVVVLGALVLGVLQMDEMLWRWEDER